LKTATSSNLSSSSTLATTSGPASKTPAAQANSSSPPGSALPPNFTESPIGHVAAYTFGYDRDYRILPHILTAPGAQFTTYTTPTALIPTYSRHPFGVALFVRFRIVQ